MASKVKFPKSVTLTYNACVAAVRDGLPQKDVLKQLDISKPTLKEHLLAKNTSWRELMKESKSNNTSKGSKSKGSKGKGSKNISHPSPQNPPTKTIGDPDDPEGITDQDEEINFEIPTQLKEMVRCSEYVCDRIEKASFGDAIKFYEKTKMLENEDKDFAEDNAFLGEVEALLFQYKIIEEQSPALDVRVENPDLIEEGI